METEGSLSCFQELAIGPYPDQMTPVDSRPILISN
jgi:hypothetical protein